VEINGFGVEAESTWPQAGDNQPDSIEDASALPASKEAGEVWTSDHEQRSRLPPRARGNLAAFPNLCPVINCDGTTASEVLTGRRARSY